LFLKPRAHQSGRGGLPDHHAWAGLGPRLARDLATQYLAGCVPAGLQLLGVVTVADAPGRLPAPLASARHLLTGVYTHVWSVPYVPEYRLLTRLPAEPCPPTHPAVADVLAAIRSAASAATSGKGPHA